MVRSPPGSGRVRGQRRWDGAQDAHCVPAGALDSPSPMAYCTSWLINQQVTRRMTPDRLSMTLAALADPTRRAILARLAAGEASVSDLAAPFKMTLPGVSKHLKVLRR